MELDVMLCDYAQVVGGKLFVSGANIERIAYPAGTQGPYVTNFGIAGLVTVPWNATNVEHALSFRVVTQDGTTPRLAIEPQPDEIAGEIRFNVGRAPEVVHGDSQTVPFAFMLNGLPLAQPGRIVIVTYIDQVEMRRMPFTLSVERSVGFPAGPAGIPHNPLL